MKDILLSTLQEIDKLDLDINKMVYIGYRKGEEYPPEDFFWDQMFTVDIFPFVFVGIPSPEAFKKNNISDILASVKAAFEESYVLFCKKDIVKKRSAFEYYEKFLKPGNGEILDLIIRSRFSRLIDYEIETIILAGDNEDWARLIKLD